MRNRNQVVIPLDLGIRIDENAPVRKLIEICDELDYTDLYRTYLRHWRKIDPRTMFELLVFAYMNGIYSSREIESSCRHDIRFMWILQNEPVPDHSTIARFQNERLTGVMEDLFYQLTEKLYQMGELSYKNMFVDGTKIEANANRYTFVWAKAVAKQLEKLEVRIATGSLCSDTLYPMDTAKNIFSCRVMRTKSPKLCIVSVCRICPSVGYPTKISVWIPQHRFTV